MPTLLWIQNFLTTRTQKVVVDGSFSDNAHVGSGVPQGTVLGPILFLCYINDLPSSVSSDVRLFADDCLLYRPIWGMKFNPSKCSVLWVKRPRAKEIASDYQLKGVTLGQVTNSPHLGVSISENLEWGDHISKIASKANSTLGFLRRNLKGCPSKLKEIAYFSMVRSLEYSCPVWDPYRQGDIDKLNKIQRAAARFVTNNYQRKSSVTALVQDLGWTDLQTRRKNFRLTSLYKILNGLIAVPVSDLLTPADERTRGGYKKSFKHIRANTTLGQNSFLYKNMPDWNHLPPAAIESRSIAAFKSQLSD